MYYIYFTATTSESGNGGSNSRSQNKTTSGTKETNENNSAGDSADGEKLYSGGTGTGTSGGNKKHPITVSRVLFVVITKHKFCARKLSPLTYYSRSSNFT